jgi:hypothetical protein
LVDKNANFTMIRSILNQVHSHVQNVTLPKDTVKELLQLAESDAERQRVTYAICQSTGLSTTKLRDTYGFEDINSRMQNVEEALRQAKEIRESVEHISHIKEQAVLRSCGISFSESENSDQEDDSEESCSDNEYPVSFPQEDVISSTGSDEGICQSYVAKPNPTELSTFIDGLDERDSDIQSESDAEDNPGLWKKITDPLQQEARSILEKRIKSVRLKARRKAAKAIAESRLLRRKRSKRVGRIVRQFPDIGKTIETMKLELTCGGERVF